MFFCVVFVLQTIGFGHSTLLKPLQAMNALKLTAMDRANGANPWRKPCDVKMLASLGWGMVSNIINASGKPLPLEDADGIIKVLQSELHHVSPQRCYLFPLLFTLLFAAFEPDRPIDSLGWSHHLHPPSGAVSHCSHILEPVSSYARQWSQRSKALQCAMQAAQADSLNDTCAVDILNFYKNIAQEGLLHVVTTTMNHLLSTISWMTWI